MNYLLGQTVKSVSVYANGSLAASVVAYGFDVATHRGERFKCGIRNPPLPENQGKFTGKGTVGARWERTGGKGQERI